jgi:hypothetical protein
MGQNRPLIAALPDRLIHKVHSIVFNWEIHRLWGCAAEKLSTATEKDEKII